MLQVLKIVTELILVDENENICEKQVTARVKMYVIACSNFTNDIVNIQRWRS